MFPRTADDTRNVTSNRRLHRLAAFTAVSVLFGVTSTVSALATQHDAAPQAAPAAVVTNVSATEDAALTAKTALQYAPAATRTAVPVKKVTTTVVKAKAVSTTKVQAKATTKAKATTRKTTTAAAKVVTAGTRTISSYVDAPGSQKAIDSCKLVLWTHSPLWLAGHNWCGWAWMATVPTGTIVKVTKGAAAGTFVVTGHVRLSRQSGALPTVHADLVLQTCVGSGTGLTLLRRV
jgi:hypothetical protein